MSHGALLETLLKGYEEGALRGFFANLTNCISADEEESWGALRDPDRGERSTQKYFWYLLWPIWSNGPWSSNQGIK
jgi:hypothetical protein